MYITGRREKVIQDAAAMLNGSGSGKAIAIVADSSSKDSIQHLVGTVEASGITPRPPRQQCTIPLDLHLAAVL